MQSVIAVTVILNTTDGAYAEKLTEAIRAALEKDGIEGVVDAIVVKLP
jgi:hypothetical protein